MIAGRDNSLINAELIRSNNQYKLWDNTLLKNLTLSETQLRVGQSTNGHYHEGKEEIYFFTKGSGAILIATQLLPVKAGDVVLIPAGAFHKVAASVDHELWFLSVFESYQR